MQAVLLCLIVAFCLRLHIRGEAQRLGFDKVMSINADAIEDLIPDIVLYIDTNIDTAMNRVFDARGDKWGNNGGVNFIWIRSADTKNVRN